MRRSKARSGRDGGLFSWAPADGEIAVGELLVNPLTAYCRHCHAGKGQRCTRLGRGRRHDISPHPCRRDDAVALAHQATVPAADAAPGARTESPR